jgi:RNA polymerase sigma-70 factor, ECF subfamily
MPKKPPTCLTRHRAEKLSSAGRKNALVRISPASAYNRRDFGTVTKHRQVFQKMTSPQEITQLLLAWERSDPLALERLLPLVEAELRQIARGYLRKEKPGHLLQTTALINEAFIKLVDQTRVHWQNRAHFFGIAATCMRRVLTDYARAQARDKRGGGAEQIALEDAPSIPVETPVELLALDEALRKLEKQDARKSRIVELRYFGGCTVAEVASLLGVSEETINREWRLARAWLRRELDSKPEAMPTNKP